MVLFILKHHKFLKIFDPKIILTPFTRNAGIFTKQTSEKQKMNENLV